MTPWIDGPLCRFLGLRHAIPAMFSAGIQSRPPCAGDVHLGGEWVYFRRRDGQAELGENLLRNFPHIWQEAHHASSVYVLHRVSVHGLFPGWNSVAGNRAIYTHPLRYAGRCMKYSMYVHLFQDGLYVAIKFRLAVMRQGNELHGRRITMTRKHGVKQWLTYPGCHHILGFWMHILRQEELPNLYPTTQGVLLNRRWQGVLELHPEDTDEQWQERSRRMAQVRSPEAEHPSR